MNNPQGVFAICILALVLNLPFGWLRTYTRKFSLGWMLCVHAPIPIVAFIRIYTKTSWHYIPFFLLFSVAGQIAGARIKTKVKSS